MKRLITLLTICIFFCSHSAWSKGFVVIVNEENPIEANISQYFKLRLGEWPNGEKVEPAEIKVGQDLEKGIIQNAFVTRFLKVQSVAEYREYWIRQKSKGKTKRPVEKKSFRAVLRHVRREAGGVGYIPQKMAEGASGVRIVGEFRP